MGHGHNHTHGQQQAAASGAYLNKAFTVGITLNILFVAVELAAGFILNSVALISDAGHNLSDVISLALAMMAFKLARTKPTGKYTYGRKKSTIMVSFANACILMVAIGVIIYESIGKLLDPQPIEGGAIAWVAGVGIIINTFTALLFMRDRHKDLNVKGAYLHMMADALVSVGVVISGIVISYTGWYHLDAVIGIIIAVVIFISTWRLLRESVRLSLDGIPAGIDLTEVIVTIKSCDSRITDVHHVHIWPLSTTENALTAHVVIDPKAVSPEIKANIKKALYDLNIGHSTLEFESPGEHPRSDCYDCAPLPGNQSGDTE